MSVCQGHVWLSTVHNEDTRKVSRCRYVIHSIWSGDNFFVLHIHIIIFKVHMMCVRVMFGSPLSTMEILFRVMLGS